MAGTNASDPEDRRLSTPSVNGVVSSSKHQAIATEASNTTCLKRLMAASFFDKLADADLAESQALAQTPDVPG
jgi:hypothetical protein